MSTKKKSTKSGVDKERRIMTSAEMIVFLSIEAAMKKKQNPDLGIPIVVDRPTITDLIDEYVTRSLPAVGYQIAVEKMIAEYGPAVGATTHAMTWIASEIYKRYDVCFREPQGAAKM